MPKNKDTNVSKWEEEFDKLLEENGYDRMSLQPFSQERQGWYYNAEYEADEEVQNLKAFIQTQITKARGEGLQRVLDIIQREPCESSCVHTVVNRAIQKELGEKE